MARITRPLDVPHVTPTNNYRPTPVADNPVWAATRELSETVQGIVDTAREQQIDNDVRRGELNLRTRLDAVRQQVEQDPDYETMPQRWTEAARQVDEELSQGMTSPMHQRLWRERAERMLATEGGVIHERTQMRAVETARAGLITNLGELRRTITDPNTTPETRREAQRLAEIAIAEAANRRTLGMDDAAQQLNGIRDTVAEFDRTEGLRAQAQAEEDRIWLAARGDYATAMGMVNQIQNPQLRDTVGDRVSQRHAREEAGASETLESAMEAAHSAIENGETLESLTAEQQRVLDASGNMQGLRDYIRARATPESSASFTRQSQEIRYSIESLNRPGTSVLFASIDLETPKTAEQSEQLARYGIIVPEGTRIRDMMTPENFNQLRSAQRYARGEEGSGEGNRTLPQLAGRNLITYAEQIGGGRLDGISGSEDNVERQRQFHAYLMREAEDFVRMRNREPTTAEARQIINLALTEVRTGFFGNGSTRVFQSTDEDQLRVEYNSIPQWQQERLLDQLEARMNAAGQNFRMMNREDIMRRVEVMYADEISAGQ